MSDYHWPASSMKRKGAWSASGMGLVLGWIF